MDSIVAELRGAGVEVTEPVLVANGLQAFLHDPSGNTVELYQPANAVGPT
jgi:hypothetical protein